MSFSARDVFPVPVFMDNYAWVLPLGGGAAAVVDPGEAAPVAEALRARGLRLDAILLTHHHPDHVAGAGALQATCAAGGGRPRIIGAEVDRHRLPPLDEEVGDGALLTLGAGEAAGVLCRVMAVPGHTTGHVAFVIEDALFPGDTLFRFGCGRLFEGTAEEMWASLQSLAALPDETLVFCGHEYTESNLRFALHLKPDDEDLRSAALDVARCRADGLPTMPAPLGDEKRHNPFLRCGVDLFRTRRAAKDRFA